MAAVTSPKHHFAHEIPQDVFDDEDLTDDSTGIIPMIGLKTPVELQNRFTQRLSKITAARVRVQESEDQSGIIFYLTRNSGSPQGRIELDVELKSFVESIGDSLATISKSRSGSACKQAEDELWDEILIHSYSNIDHVTNSLERSFTTYKAAFDEFVTKMFGVSDQYASGSQLDRDLGDRLIEFHQNVQAYDQSMRQFHVLIQLASAMAKTIEPLQDRLSSILENVKFGKELYALLITLGFPERAYSTFVRAAKTYQPFAKVQFRLSATASSSPRQKEVSFAGASTNHGTNFTIMPSESVQKLGTARIVSATPPSGRSIAVRTPSPPLPPRPQRSITKQRASIPAGTASKLTPSSLPFIQTNDIFAVVRPYLSDEDRAVDLIRLQPSSKHDSAQLVATVLRGKLLPRHTSAFHTFGFVTLRSESEERTLGGLYAAILQESTHPPSIFSEIMEAVETHTLVNLINRKEFSHILSQLPLSLSTFLAMPTSERPTVWRLVQFAADESSTSPPAHLQRDYGFKMCRQREEVQRLKDIYGDVLKTNNPLDLHNACLQGRLWNFAKSEGRAMPQDKRLMSNDAPASHVGFENGMGLGAYRGAFFRRG